MQKVLGEQLRKVTDDSLTPQERTRAYEQAEYTAKLAKQMVNNADVVLRTDKMCNKSDRINKVVGE